MIQKTTFELVYDGKIKLCFPTDSPEEAGEYVKNEIAGNGDWKDLVGLDPDRCQLRVTTVKGGGGGLAQIKLNRN